MYFKKYILILFAFIYALNSSAQCSDPNACNFGTELPEECMYPGDPCDDGNAQTSNETFNEACNCIDGGFPLAGCTDISACNFSPTAQIDDDSCVFPLQPCEDEDAFTLDDFLNDECECIGSYSVDFSLYDSGFNGWDEAQITLVNTTTGDIYPDITLVSGGFEEFSLNLVEGCYEMTSTTGENPEEISFLISVESSFGTEDIFGTAGDAQTFSVGGIAGCTDPLALNYDTEATCETGDCFYCIEDGDCLHAMNENFNAGPCHEVTICGPGLFKINGTSYSGYVEEGECEHFYLSISPGAYDVRIKADEGSSMSVIFGGVTKLSGTGGHDECIYIDVINCKVYKYVWNKSRSTISMNDDLGTGWDLLSYEIHNESNELVAEGTLSTAEGGDGEYFGFDTHLLNDGCYFLSFISELEDLGSNYTYRLDNIDGGFIAGVVDNDVIPFTIGEFLCGQGCTDQSAVNFDPAANVPCNGNNSCCDYTPSNNQCDNAMFIEPVEIYNWETKNATSSEFNCESEDVGDIWYRYTASCDELIAFSGTGIDGFQFCVYNSCPTDENQEPLFSSADNQYNLNQYAAHLNRDERLFFRISTDSNYASHGEGQFLLDILGCRGCTDPEAYNYTEEATLDDGSCLLPFECVGDLNGDNKVSSADLTIFLSSFGENCVE